MDREVSDSAPDRADRLLKKIDALERRVALQGALIAVLAHDLRNPLTSMLGYLELIRREQLAPLPLPLQGPVASIQRNGDWVRSLVDHISALASHRPPPDACDLMALVRRVCDEVQPLADQYRNQLLRPEGPALALRLDPAAISFALLQLLLLRIKRSTGAVSVQVTAQAGMACVELTSGTRERERLVPPRGKPAPYADVGSMRWEVCLGLVEESGGALDEVVAGAESRIRITFPLPPG